MIENMELILPVLGGMFQTTDEVYKRLDLQGWNATSYGRENNTGARVIFAYGTEKRYIVIFAMGTEVGGYHLGFNAQSGEAESRSFCTVYVSTRSVHKMVKLARARSLRQSSGAGLGFRTEHWPLIHEMCKERNFINMLESAALLHAGRPSKWVPDEIKEFRRDLKKREKIFRDKVYGRMVQL